MTHPTTTTDPRQERGIALAQQGSVKALDAQRTVFHVKSSQPGKAPYSVRRLMIQQRWTCTCEDFRRNAPTHCKHIYAAQRWLQMPRVVLTVTPRRSSVECSAYIPGVVQCDSAVLVRHHQTGNTTIELSWSIVYIEEFLHEEIDWQGNRTAVLRADGGTRWHIPAEAWRAIQPPTMRNPSPEVEMVLGGAA